MPIVFQLIAIFIHNDINELEFFISSVPSILPKFNMLRMQRLKVFDECECVHIGMRVAIM